MWELLRRFKALDSSSRGLFLRASALLPLISASLFFRGFGATQATLRRFLPERNRTIAADRRGEISQTSQMVAAAARYGLGHPTCLEKSLTLWWLLGRRGISSTLRLGARTEAGRFEAHAWVDCGGVALYEKIEPHAHYAAFEAEIPALSERSA
jgi:hypothetical protein